MYREKLVFHNRGTHTMKIFVRYPKELGEYVEFNPTNGYIQPLSDFESWIKFNPRPDILTKCKRYLTGDEQITVVLKVMSELQAVPVLFKLKAEFTTDSLEITPRDIDFGQLYDQVAPSVKVRLMNRSKLPQKLSFFQIPKELIAEPDKGCLHLLPLEQSYMTLTFNPQRDEFYGDTSGTMWLRVLTGEIMAKELKMTFTATKEKCPVLFDKSKILYPSLSEGETCESLVTVSLNTGMQKDYMVEFTPPPYKLSGLKFCPRTAVAKPGKPVLMQILYDARVRNYDGLVAQELQAEMGNDKPVEVLKNRLIEEELKKKVEEVKKDKKKEEKKAVKKEVKKVVKKTKKQEEEEELARIQEEEAKKKEEEERLQKILADFNKEEELYKFGGRVYDNIVDNELQSQHYEWLVPCSFIPTDKSSPVKTTYIYIKTVVSRPTLLVVPQTLDFGELAVSCRKVLYLDIENADDEMCVPVSYTHLTLPTNREV
eukprot:TRINITY_DN5628_c0_g4_i1.p1 TRINITY_DN5628_c0_g4~~TRINITY_DN5628_c0_g4_i1.p1  ORF type:complete len:485 (+),score=154.68 TRINITY_DN5628_c0_g4_i1:678-2132(+)